VTDISASFNPYGIKLAYLLRAQQAFGVKVLPLMKKIEKAGADGLNVESLELEELLTFVFLAMDMAGEKPTRDSLLDADLDDLGARLTSLVGTVTPPDPT
jgi:hypothetical protein